MSRIKISQVAIKKIEKGIEFHASRGKAPPDTVPVLTYFQRAYSMLNDGRTVEHGDGFMLHFPSPEGLRETDGVGSESVNVGERLAVIVQAPSALLSKPFSIGWSNSKFTLEPPEGP